MKKISSYLFILCGKSAIVAVFFYFFRFFDCACGSAQNDILSYIVILRNEMTKDLFCPGNAEKRIASAAGAQKDRERKKEKARRAVYKKFFGKK